MIGKTLVHYEISAEIGKGGMGEVYQAKDTKLGRDVAIKVLPEEFARDTDRVARFQREAKLLASLNHPNIAAIHGLEESEGTHFLVMELIEGDTLRDRIKSGPIPVEEALKLALQMAEALEAAHEKGVIHRDLKPANIKVTPDGKVKILDFGLAKAYAGDQGNINLADSPTISAAATQQGVILGTAAYMSPEQARGKPVDKRADIWSFGCVLYEMLTAQAAFQGEDVTEVLAAVVKSGVNLNLLPENIHPKVRETLERCLEKDTRNRYHDIADARVDIQKVLTDSSGVFVQPITAVKPKKKLRLGIQWVTAIAIFCLIIAGAAVWKFKPSEPKQVIRFDYELPAGQQPDNSGNPSLAISPDGSKLAYNTSNGLYLHFMDQSTAKLIVGSETSPRQPFFSPDGQWVGYWSEAENKLKKTSVNGGAPVTIVNTTVNPVRPTWSDDETIVYGEYGTGKVNRVPANGGTPEVLAEIQEKMVFGPQMLPDAESVLFTQYDGNEYQIAVQSIKSGESRELLSIQGFAYGYVPTGHIVYNVGNDLFAVPFDLDKLEVTGGQVSVEEGIVWFGGTAAPQFAISNSGTLIFSPRIAEIAIARRVLVWVNKDGYEEPIEAEPNIYRFPKISPDGNQVVLRITDQGNQYQEIYIWDDIRKTLNKRTFDKSDKMIPIWTPDGERIVYSSNHETDQSSVYWRPANGTGEAEKLASVPDRALHPYSFSSDGKFLVMQELVSMTNSDISILPMEDDGERRLLLQSEFVEGMPKISPDNQYIAYAYSESGQAEIYVRPFPDVNKGIWQISQGGGTSPLWSPDGKELFYISLDNSVIAVDVETKPIFDYGTPRMLFQSKYVGFSIGEGTPWDIHPDGKRFLMMKELGTDTGEVESDSPSKINLVLNWFEELKQRVPVD